MISIIIPSLNEAVNLERLLSELSRQAEGHEIIIVDGGSDDGSSKIAAKYGVEIMNTGAGRGQQLKAGAAEAKGEILLFLHADSRFPAGGLAAVEGHLTTEFDCIGGNFRLLFDGDTKFSRWLIKFYAWIRRRGLYYGDSGVFVRREIYQKIGGIRAVALMEDYDFIRRLEKAGRTCCIEEPALITSSRKFEGRMPLEIIWGWLKIHALFHLGVSPERLAQMYYRNG